MKLNQNEEIRRRELYHQGLNDAEIARKLSVTKDAIFMWRKKRGLAANCLQGPPKKISLEPTWKLGYFCGLLLGDGCLCYDKTNRAHLISFETPVKEFAGIIFGTMHQVGLNPSLRERIRIRKLPNDQVTDLHYEIKACSKVLYETLQPYKKSNKPWFVPKFLTSDESLKGFLRGIYDAEGSVSTYFRWKSSQKESVYITLCSKFGEGLLEVASVLRRFGIEPTPKLNRSSTFHLVIAKKASVQKFAEQIGFNLSWKKEKLLRVFDVD